MPIQIDESSGTISLVGQLESTLVLAIKDAIRWESSVDLATQGTLTPIDPERAFNPLEYQQRDRELAKRDVVIGAAIVDTSVEISNVYNYPALKPLLEGPALKDLPFDGIELTSAGTTGMVRHVKNSSVPYDASRYADSDLYGRDALLFDILARAAAAAFTNPPITPLDPSGTSLPGVTAWSLAEGSKIKADINPALPLNRDLFKLPDQNLAYRDNILATYIATLAQVLKNPFLHALRIYVKVDGPGTSIRESEVYVLASDDGVNRVWKAEPALADRNRIIYSIPNRTLQWVRESEDSIHVPQIYAMTIAGIDSGQSVTTIPSVPETKDAQFWRLKAGQVVPAGEKLLNTSSYLSFTASDAVNGGTTQVDGASLTAPGLATFTLPGILPRGAYRVSALAVPTPHVEIAGAQNISSTSGTLGGATFDVDVASGAITTKQYIVVGGDGISYNSKGYAAGQVFYGVSGVTTYAQAGAVASSVRQYAVNFQLPLTPGAWRVKIDYTDLSGVSTGFGIKAQYIAAGANAVNVLQDATLQPFTAPTGMIVTTPAAGFDVSNTGAFAFPVFWTYGTGQLHIRKITFESDTRVGHYQIQGGFAGSIAVVDVIGTAFQPDVLRFEFRTSGTVNPVTFSTNWVTEAQLPLKFKQIDVQSLGTFTPTPVSDEFSGWRQECVDRAERVVQQTYTEALMLFGTNVPTFRDSGSHWSPTATEQWMSFVETTHPRLREVSGISGTGGIIGGRQYQVVSGPVFYGTHTYTAGQRFYGDATTGTGFTGGSVKQVGAFIKSRPGHIGRPALIPYGLTYSGNGTVASYYDTRQSIPMIASCIPWMIDQGIYVAQDDFWMSDFLVVGQQSQEQVVAPLPVADCQTPTSFPVLNLPANTYALFTMGYHPPTQTMWVPDNDSSNVYIFDTITATLIHTLDMTVPMGGADVWEILWDSVNDQMVIREDGANISFVDPYDYSILATLTSVIGNSGATYNQMTYDSTRGNILLTDTLDTSQSVGHNSKQVLISGATHTILQTNTYTNRKLSNPVYCSSTDKFYFSFTDDQELKALNPNSLALTGTGLSFPNANEYGLFYHWVPELNRMFIGVALNGADTVTRVTSLNPVTLTFIGDLTGAAVPGGGNWGIQDIEYNSCEGTLYVCDFENVFRFNVSTLAEIDITPADLSTSLVYVRSQNLMYVQLSLSDGGSGDHGQVNALNISPPV